MMYPAGAYPMPGNGASAYGGIGMYGGFEADEDHFHMGPMVHGPGVHTENWGMTADAGKK